MQGSSLLIQSANPHQLPSAFLARIFVRSNIDPASVPPSSNQLPVASVPMPCLGFRVEGSTKGKGSSKQSPRTGYRAGIAIVKYCPIEDMEIWA
jgi:hypothetical protein